MDIKKLVRQNILNLKPYTSARDLYSNGILLDANENSIGSTFTEINGLNLNRYPDPHQNDLRDLISNRLNITKENLFFGVGSDEIIDLLIRIFCEPGKNRIMIPEPTYGMYRVSADINNVSIVSVLLNDDFQIDFDEIEKNYSEDIKVIFLCSPNNPTGNLLNKDDVLKLCMRYYSIIIIDEAYIDFADGGSLINEVNNYPNLIVMRTFSKAWGLAGVRLGFCVANELIIKLLFKVKAPYNINTLTRYALKKAIKNEKLKNSFIKMIIEEREKLHQEISKLDGISKIFDSDANFLLIKCDNTKNVLQKLANKGIIIRDRSDQPKLEDCLRISVGTEKQNIILLDALKEIMK